MILQTETNVNKLSLKPENRYSSLTNNDLNLSTDFVDNSGQLPIPLYFYPLLKKAKLRLAPKKNGSINSLYALFKMISYGCTHYKSYNPTQESMGNIIKRYGLKDGLCREQVNRLCFELEDLGLMRHTTLGINHYYLTELGKQLYLIYSGKNINVTPYIDIPDPPPDISSKTWAKEDLDLPLTGKKGRAPAQSQAYAHPIDKYIQEYEQNIHKNTITKPLDAHFIHDPIKHTILSRLLKKCSTSDSRDKFLQLVFKHKDDILDLHPGDRMYFYQRWADRCFEKSEIGENAYES